MDRCRSGIVLGVALLLMLIFAGCVGKSSPQPGNTSIQSVTLTPTGNLSIDLGATQQFTATARNATGQTVLTTFHFSATCLDPQPCAPLGFSSSGLACAGSWDSATNPVVCSPGVAGVAVVTASAGGVSSPPTTIYVHQHIDNITVAPVGTPPTACFSPGDIDPEKRAWRYQATAWSNGADITNSVGPINWSSTPTGVLTADTTLSTLQPNQVEVTAKDPGRTQLFASVSGVTSSPLPFTTCLVSYIRLQIQGASGDTINLAAGGTKTVVATAVDTLGNVVSKPPLTGTTSNPEVATVTNGAVSAKQASSAAAISASCTPPTCNIGVLPSLPIYASNGPIPNVATPGFGAITVNVNNAKPPAYTAWTTSTGCGTAFNCTTAMFSVTEGKTPIGTTVELPRTPNSMQFIPTGTRVYVGSDQGLMFVDVGSTATVGTVSSAASPCNVTLCGKVLAISQDGNRVVVADTVTKDQIYIYDNAHPTATVDLLIPNATAAAFSPDLLKVFILSGNGRLYIASTVDAVSSIVVPSNTSDMAFSADGSFAYVAGAPGNSVSGYSTCLDNGIPDNVLSPVPTTHFPVAIRPLPNLLFDTQGRQAQSLLALNPPTIDTFTVSFVQRDPIEQPGGSGHFVCRSPIVGLDSTDFPSTSFDLGQGQFTPVLMQVVGSSQVVIVAKNVPAVLFSNLAGGTTTPIPLVNNGAAVAASSSQDGSQVFVAACEEFQDNDLTKPCLVGSVHIVNPLNGGDIQQVPFTNVGTNDSMCSNLDPNAPPCLPDLIAVKPQ